jgi:catechol 2,3-dioxygenase-like lactoylglutathione lyase family enzyme
MTGFDFRVAGIDHVVLRIADRDRALGFYRDVLGCPVEREQAEVGLTQLRAGRALIDLVTVGGALGRLGGAAPGMEGRNLDHVALGLAPWHEGALHDHLSRAGIEVVESGERYGAGGFGPSLYVRDPDGNLIELKPAEG